VVTSALIGVRNLKQLKENVESLKNLNFSKKELSLINIKAKDGGIKQSGYGREGGSMAIKDYLNVKYTHMGIKG